MGARKSGNNIYVEGTGNTLSGIVANINDTDFMIATSEAPSGVYTVNCSTTDRYLYVRPGGELIIGSGEDYSFNETLEYDIGLANRGRFYVQAGGHLKQYGDTTIDFSKDGTAPYYGYIWGALTVRGDETYKPTWKNFARIYFYEQSDVGTYTDDIWDVDGMKVGTGVNSTSYFGFLYSIGKVRNHSFKNMEFDKNIGHTTGNTHYFYLNYTNSPWHNVVFSGLTFTDVYYGFQNLRGTPIKLEDCTWTNTASWITYNINAPTVSPWIGQNNFDATEPRQHGQHFTLYKGCNFDDAGIGNYVELGAACAFVDCTWTNTTSPAAQIRYDAHMIIWSGNVWNDASNLNANYNGAVLWVKSLDLTVEDSLGRPIEDATVVIEQSDGREYWTFKTKSNGKLDNIYDLECALLTHQYFYTSASYYYWSDNDNDTYHNVTVFKDGYIPVTKPYVMDQDRTVTIKLRKINSLKVEV